MQFHLVFHIDKEGYDGIFLETFSNLKEMDNFIEQSFNNRADVLKKYNQEISEFCLDNKERIENENKRNNHNRLGSISLFFETKKIHKKIPIIYKNDQKLLSNNSCLKKIEMKLQDDNILNKLCLSKNYLLSKNEIDLVNLYYKFPYDVQKKNDAISFFINRIKKMDDDKKYFYFRNLMNLFKLNEIELKISKGVVSNINIPNDSLCINKTKDNKIVSRSEDDFFNKLVDNLDYDNLYNMYDIDVIDRDTNIFKKV